MTEKYKRLSASVEGKDASGIIAEVYEHFPVQQVVVASSCSFEDQLLTHYVCEITAEPRIFTLDTGRLFNETYATLERTMRRYDFTYEIIVPDTGELEMLLREHGPDCFYNSVEERKMCCMVRKTHPLKRVLSTADVWICGLRRDQSVTRTAVSAVEWDGENKMIKINPLFDWDEQRVVSALHEKAIPYNPLQDTGYRSIGCASCTRPVGEGESLRAGRWWWEDPEHKECGLHTRTTITKTM